MAKFGEAYDLVLLIDKFVHLNGGFRSEFYIRIGFNLPGYLVGVGTNKCSDDKLYTNMLELSRVILHEALEGLDKIDIELCELQQLLADLVPMMSEQKKYRDLEVSHLFCTFIRLKYSATLISITTVYYSLFSHVHKANTQQRILQTLWKTRIIRNNISSSPLVLYLGRSLVQTLACLNRFSEAIHLCYQIRYNLEYIRGVLDRSTLKFTILLSELYTV